jgi:hypothetical protein
LEVRAVPFEQLLKKIFTGLNFLFCEMLNALAEDKVYFSSDGVLEYIISGSYS